MTELYHIAKHPTLQPSQDYAALRREGIQHIERLARQLWTDYNIHDPGVTILELLCYAITDLGYRTAYPIKDLLTREQNGKTESLADFHTAREVLTCNPVSFSDLAKLLVDIPGVRNAWVEKNQAHKICLDSASQQLMACTAQDDPGAQTLNGLYDIYIEFEDRVLAQSKPHYIGLAEKLPAGGDYIAANKAGIRFDVDYPLTLQAVTLYAEAPGQVTVRLLDDQGHVQAESTHDITQGNVETPIELNFAMSAGRGYRLEAQADVKLYRNKPASGEALFPFELAHLIHLRSGFNPGNDASPIYYFFYHWVIQYSLASGDAEAPEDQPRDMQLARDDVEWQIRQRLHQYRNLCEEPVKLCELIPEEVAVCADLELQPGADAEQVLAELFVRLRQHVSPPVHFYSLQEMFDKGYTSDQIFAGPALDHGFIDDTEFSQRRRRCEIRASDVINIILSVEGVLAVHKLNLLAFEQGVEQPHQSADWLLPLSDAQTRAPSFKWQRSQIVFYQNKLPRYPDRARVASLLRERHEGDARRRIHSTHQSDGATHDLPIPVGEDRALADYYPAQNELPMTYRVGPYRVPQSEPPLRHAQAKQLKAYLMFFEQLLANYLSQLDHMHQLFSWQADTQQTYFTQLVQGVRDLEDVYLAAYADEDQRRAELHSIIEDPTTAASRRNAFLDHLLARFCEDFTEYSLLMYGLYEPDAAAQRLIDDKRTFLTDYPAISAGRGRAHDMRDAGIPGELSGFQQRLYRMLGFAAQQHDDLAGHALEIDQSSPDPAQPWHFVLRLPLAGDEGAGEVQTAFISRGCENRESSQVLLDLAIQLAGDKKNYRASGNVHELVMRCPDEEIRVIGTTTEGTTLGQVTGYFAQLADVRGFHLVEHILLRPRSPDDPLLPVQLNTNTGAGECACVEVTDPYSFRISVILPSWPLALQDTRMRAFVEGSIRRECPAHIFPRICWISHAQMLEFEVAQQAWRTSLATQMAQAPMCATAETSEQPIEYTEKLGALIRILHQLDNVHPLTRLYNCEAKSGEIPRVFLDHSNLGTF